MSLRKTLKKWLYSYTPGLAGRFPYCGTKVYFPPDAFIFDIVVREGIYEQQLLKHILGVIQPGTWYFDVGSNIGLMSVPILQNKPDVRVLSFEPSPNSKSFLQQTWSHSPWKDRWKVSDHAVGDHVGEVQFTVSATRFAGYDGIRNTGRAPQAGVANVPLTTLDVEWKALGSPAVSCMKLDMEGAEALALTGASELIRTARPYIFVEWYAENLESFGCDADFLLKFAQEYRYDAVAVPTLTPIASLPILLMNMRVTSAFVLVPRSPSPATIPG